MRSLAERADVDAWDELNHQVIACRQCPRLVEWRESVAREKRRAFRDWVYWGRPVPGCGDHQARLLIVGLAPAAHGANRTGRVFTGDGSANFLVSALYRAGFANRPTSVHRDDGLEFRDAYVAALVRCAPPANRPAPQEILNCRPYLVREVELLRSLQVVLALGRVAWEGYLRVVRESGVAVPRISPVHGGAYEIAPGLPRVVFSYHPSQQNTQTGRLTPAMLDAALQRVRELFRDDA
jgi:uracil-DNA glycosylase